MSKLKSFEQFVAEKDRASEIEQEVVDQGTTDIKDAEEVESEAEEVQSDEESEEVAEATVVMDAVDPKSKGLLKLLKKHNVSIEVIDKNGPSGFPEVELTGDRKDLEKVLADSEHGWDDAGLADYIEESNDTFKVKVELLGESDSGKEAEELEDETKDVTEPKEFDGEEVDETPNDDSEELEDELEGEGDAEGDEISESEEAEEVNENPAAAIAVASMLKEVYEACKKEAKAYEEDAHDEHTIESYMKENAALVGALAATALKEMKEEYTTEAYEAACNEMIEAYSKKVNELKEMDHSADAEDVE